MTTLKYRTFAFVCSEVLDESEVKKLKDWCEMTLSVKDDLAAVYAAASEAVGALAEGKFLNMSSDQFWDKGFNVDNEASMNLMAEKFFAIYDPTVNEIEVMLVGNSLSAKIDLASGSVVML